MNFTRRLFILMLAVILSVSVLIVPASAAGSVLYGIGFVNTEGLRLRSAASTTSSVVGTAHRNDCVVLIAKSGDWYKVNYNLQEGYMHAGYVDASTCENAELGYGTITGSGVNLRSGPSTAHKIAAVSAKGDSCYIIGLNKGWFKVIYKDKTCYIRSDFVALTEFPYENRASENTPKYFRQGNSLGTAIPGSSASAAPVNVSGSQILAEAQKYLGCPYVAGGASPSGFDCSGFVYYVLKQVGLSPYRTPASQFTQGIEVAKANLQTGDIVFFSSNSGRSLTHVGIYSGNGQFIHAPNSSTPVSYSDLTSGYWPNTYYGARRIA